ncbi:MAG: diadenylate cyclase CdaA, partial [Anaerolineae bacterium]|nr:diadenylate cyclase CdaA [Anaerolineae bacterium]
MTSLSSIYEEIVFRLSIRTWLEALDLLLVILVFFFLLSWAQRRQAAFLVRGALLLGILLLVVTTVIPLPTVDWLIRGTLLALLVATPIIFHPELRRFLERVGRSAGVPLAVRQTAAEGALGELMEAVDHLAANKIGALFALEGIDSLSDAIATGVPIGGQVTEDFLLAIFYGQNPLHDGAVILREEKVVAAGCVLPLTNRPLIQPGRRLGTRHRAAVGLSETTDAVVIVVSEETGEISLAQAGVLYRPLTLAALRERLYKFYIRQSPVSTRQSLRNLFGNYRQYLSLKPLRFTRRDLVNAITSLFVAILLGLAVWSFVTEQTNPARTTTVDNIALRVEGKPDGLVVMNSVPSQISARIQTTEDLISSVRASAFQGTVSLIDLPPGAHQLVISVNTSLSPVRVLSITPPTIDLELAREISRTLAVNIETDFNTPSPAFQVTNVPLATPGEVEIIGPEPLVNQVAQVKASISLANISGPIQDIRPVQALDENGDEVSGIRVIPSEVRVSVNIRQRLNALDVGVRAVTENAPPTGYW